MTLQELDLAKKKILVRVDMNVPLDNEFAITDDTRMVKAIPTLKYCLEEGCSLIIMTHLGRPDPTSEESRNKLTTQHLVEHLTELLEIQVNHCDTYDQDELTNRVNQLSFGEILLLENTRFHPGEKKADPEFAKLLASLGEVYINDAFGTAHREHASTATIARYFDQDHKAFGLLMQNELDNAQKLLDNPTSPVTAVIGGAKVSDKIQLLEKLLSFADNILIGGGMAYTFIKSNGGSIGNSLCEDDYLDLAQSILEKAKSTNTSIHLPQDSHIANAFDNNADNRMCLSNEIPDGWMGLDIGPHAQKDFENVLLKSKTILWNGPVGVFEMSNFNGGTFYIAKAIAAATEQGAYSLVGGGDSVAAVNESGLSDQVSFISTGGGAMLELLEGKELPGVKAIKS